MTNCIQESLSFPACKSRRVEASFEGGDITSDDGVLLLRQGDRVLKLSESIAKALDDPRRRASCQHDALSPGASTTLRVGVGLRGLERPSDVAPGAGIAGRRWSTRMCWRVPRRCVGSRTEPTAHWRGDCTRYWSSSAVYRFIAVFESCVHQPVGHRWRQHHRGDASQTPVVCQTEIRATSKGVTIAHTTSIKRLCFFVC
jgi:hypothetical protein